jgi:protein-disulfide isomerase
LLEAARLLFSIQLDLSQTNVPEKAIAFVAENTHLDVDKSTDCLDEHQAAGAVDQDIELGRQNGVHVTPTFFVNGVVYDGAKDTAQFKAILEAAQRGDVWPVNAVSSQPNPQSIRTSDLQGIQGKYSKVQ